VIAVEDEMHSEPGGASPFTTAQVEAALDKVRPGIERHGGRLDLVCVEGCDVRVALRGACVGCPSSTMTLKYAIEQQLREELAGFGELLSDAPAPDSSARPWWRKIL
jgi:Fe-S cluster biogenesis protein NfuA